MELDTYSQLAMRTAKNMGSLKMDLIHGALGIASDAGELVDAIKKHTVYGKELDTTNVIEEIGDCLWFLALIASALDIKLSHVAEINIQKLERRYPEKYTGQAAIERADKNV